jgi:DNA polymerase III epsilon subunit-like protein
MYVNTTSVTHDCAYRCNKGKRVPGVVLFTFSNLYRFLGATDPQFSVHSMSDVQKPTLYIVFDLETNGIRTPQYMNWTEKGWSWKVDSSMMSDVIEIAACAWDQSYCPMCSPSGSECVLPDLLPEEKDIPMSFECLLQTNRMDEGAFQKHGISIECTQTGLEPNKAWAAFWSWVGQWAATRDVVLISYACRLLDLPMLLYHSVRYDVPIPPNVQITDGQRMASAFCGRRPLSLADAARTRTVHCIEEKDLHRAAADVRVLCALLNHSGFMRTVSLWSLEVDPRTYAQMIAEHHAWSDEVWVYVRERALSRTFYSSNHTNREEPFSGAKLYDMALPKVPLATMVPNDDWLMGVNM